MIQPPKTTLAPSGSIVPADDAHIALAADLIRNDQVVAFPTETVYGLGASAFSSLGVASIFKLKGRPSSNPLIVHIASPEELSRVAVVTASLAARLTRLEKLWPGPLTVVLPKSERVSSAVTAGGPSVGVRIPDHSVARRLIEKAGLPIAAPSANRSNGISPTCAAHVLASLGHSVPMILDGGSSAGGIESTVISLIGNTPRILRPGIVTPELLQELLGEKVEVGPGLSSSLGSSLSSSTSSLPAESPGQGDLHYSPTTPTIFVSQFDPTQWRARRIGYIQFTAHTRSLPFAATTTISLSKDGNLTEVAQGLYSALHTLDTEKLDLILVDECEKRGIGLAIMDRLRRAVRR